MRNRLSDNQSGATLVELLVVIGMFSVISVLTLHFFLGTLSGQAKTEGRIELQEQLRHSMERVVYEVRRARGIEAETDFDVNLATTIGATLELDMPDALDDPTIIDIASGILRITNGAGPTAALTTDEIEVTNLTISDRSTANGRSEQIHITLTGEKADPTGTSALDAVLTLETSIELRGE